MDKVKAAGWESELRGKVIANCSVESLIDFGKSAAVFKATRDGKPVALKIFDDELIERYGDKTQLARIERELTLIGRSHPNMVEILDGGFDAETNNHFIVMGYLPGASLAKCLHEVPEENVPALIEQLANCCEYLESLSLVHRDIKPANIVLTEGLSKLILLDFGVMKPVGEVGVTDIDGIQSFIGTLQYSSPEFLLRKEDDTIEGWRALSLYQIGAVLHDLITRRPLFEEYANPYARLVLAVQNDLPSVNSTTLPSYLVDACRAALVKDPLTRLKLVSWGSFRPPIKKTPGLEARERVTKRSLLNKANAPSDTMPAAGAPELVEAVVNLLKVEARRIRNENTAAFPPLAVTRTPQDSNALQIGFRAGGESGLPEGVAIDVNVEVLDADAQAIGLFVMAWIGGIDDRPHALTSKPNYKGVFEPTAVASALEAAMYVAVDRAQAQPEAPRGTQIDLTELEVVN